MSLKADPTNGSDIGRGIGIVEGEGADVVTSQPQQHLGQESHHRIVFFDRHERTYLLLSSQSCPI